MEPSPKRPRIGRTSLAEIPQEVLIHVLLPFLTASELLLPVSLLNRRFHTICRSPILLSLVVFRMCNSSFEPIPPSGSTVEDLPWLVHYFVRKFLPDVTDDTVLHTDALWLQFLKAVAQKELPHVASQALKSYSPIVGRPIYDHDDDISIEDASVAKQSKFGGFPFIDQEEAYPLCDYDEYGGAVCGEPMMFFFQLNARDPGIDAEHIFGSDCLIQLFACPEHFHCDPNETKTKLVRIIENISSKSPQLDLSVPRHFSLDPARQIEEWSLPPTPDFYGSSPPESENRKVLPPEFPKVGFDISFGNLDLFPNIREDKLFGWASYDEGSDPRPTCDCEGEYESSGGGGGGGWAAQENRNRDMSKKKSRGMMKLVYQFVPNKYLRHALFVDEPHGHLFACAKCRRCAFEFYPLC